MAIHAAAFALMLAMLVPETAHGQQEPEQVRQGFMWGFGGALGGILGEQEDLFLVGAGVRFAYTIDPWRLDTHILIMGDLGDHHVTSLGVGLAWVPLRGFISPYLGAGASFVFGYWPPPVYGGSDGLGLDFKTGVELFRTWRVRLLAEIIFEFPLYKLRGIEPVVPKGAIVLLW